MYNTFSHVDEVKIIDKVHTHEDSVGVYLSHFGALQMTNRHVVIGISVDLSCIWC